jgi:hypothetical protein
MCWERMCQYKGCGHESVYWMQPCPNFGKGCFGPKGTPEWRTTDKWKDGHCSDCASRAKDPNPHARSSDPYRRKS